MLYNVLYNTNTILINNIDKQQKMTWMDDIGNVFFNIFKICTNPNLLTTIPIFFKLSKINDEDIKNTRINQITDLLKKTCNDKIIQNTQEPMTIFIEHLDIIKNSVQYRMESNKELKDAFVKYLELICDSLIIDEITTKKCNIIKYLQIIIQTFSNIKYNNYTSKQQVITETTIQQQIQLLTNSIQQMQEKQEKYLQMESLHNNTNTIKLEPIVEQKVEQKVEQQNIVQAKSDVKQAEQKEQQNIVQEKSDVKQAEQQNIVQEKSDVKQAEQKVEQQNIVQVKPDEKKNIVNI